MELGEKIIPDSIYAVSSFDTVDIYELVEILFEDKSMIYYFPYIVFKYFERMHENLAINNGLPNLCQAVLQSLWIWR
jgi:hypothetical protein